MKVLVVIPCIKPNYEAGFSAPLAWLFSNHLDRVFGVYASELSRELINSFDVFVVELNWFTELYEFTLIVKAIKQYNRKARILFGGLFSSIAHREVFENCDVDYYVRGDAELPLRMFLDDFPVRETPNFIGRDFESKLRYVFTQKEFKEIDYAVEWFPEYVRRRDSGFMSGDVEMYALPMIITTKSGCSCIHEGCDYCMGSKADVIGDIYGRASLVMSNDDLNRAISKVSEKYSDYCVYINSEYRYDFGGRYYKGCAHIEVDSPICSSDIESLFSSFERCVMLVPVYAEGIMGKSIVRNCHEMLALQDELHTIKFAAYTYHRELLKGIPDESVKYNLDTAFAPGWAHWDSYSVFKTALANSTRIYDYYARNQRERFSLELLK